MFLATDAMIVSSAKYVSRIFLIIESIVLKIRLENQNETEHGVIEKKYDFTYFKDYYSNDEDREILEIQGDLEEEPEEN